VEQLVVEQSVLEDWLASILALKQREEGLLGEQPVERMGLKPVVLVLAPLERPAELMGLKPVAPVLVALELALGQLERPVAPVLVPLELALEHLERPVERMELKPLVEKQPEREMESKPLEKTEPEPELELRPLVKKELALELQLVELPLGWLLGREQPLVEFQHVVEEQLQPWLA
jgi:hypothetical protein